MSAGDIELKQSLDSRLLAYSSGKQALKGIQDSQARAVLVQQLVDSVHRVRFPAVIATKRISDLETRACSTNALFDPLMAAIYHERQGDIDEACWLVFLFVHFGKSAKTGYLLTREVYDRLGGQGVWDWKSASQDPVGFGDWITTNAPVLKRHGGGFGQHRPYEKMEASSKTVASYASWVTRHGNHVQLFSSVTSPAKGDRKSSFDLLYRSMDVTRFGRLAKFDYLAMLGKVGLANIEPDRAYLQGSTGPLRGARLLLHGSTTASTGAQSLETVLADLDVKLAVGMQVLEDALCNWQKSPTAFKRFRG